MAGPKPSSSAKRADAILATPPASTRRDLRRWIYGSLNVLFAAVFAVAISRVVPNRLPSASIHLWTIPLALGVMAAGTLAGQRRGWWTAVIAGSALLLSTFVLIVRILISIAFLAGVYGGFGKTAAILGLVVIVLVIVLVALLPIAQVKFLMTRAGRRTYGMPLR
jgi:hypothetical protein